MLLVKPNNVVKLKAEESTESLYYNYLTRWKSLHN